MLVLACVSMSSYAVNPIKEGNMIAGHVIVKGTEESIPFATVMILGTNRGAVSNEEGQFEFRKLAAGKYTLRVQVMGYKTQEKTITVSAEATSVVHFQMEEVSFTTDEVVVSANRNEVSRKAAPVVVNVMSAKLFETVNSTDLAKSLNFQSGLRVENNCQNCGFPQVRINGLEGPYSQILINSRPIISALSGVYGLEQIPVNMIERVEVVRGGGSALFGANAVGGTINIITKDPINNSFQVASTMSNMNGKSWEQYMGGNVSLVAKDNSYGIALYETYRNRNPYDADGDGFSELGKLNMNTFGMRAYYRPNYFSRINVEYHTTNEFRRGGNKFNLQPHEADITEQTKHIINSGGVSYDRYWGEKHKMSVYGSIQHTDRNSYYFVQNEWRLNRWTMLVGARLDKHNLIDHPIFSPRVNFLYKPSDNLQARLTYSTGFRAPQAYDEDLHVTAVGGEGVQIRLADGLREERSNSFSGSVDWSFPMGHWQSNILLEGFYTDLHHVFVLEDIGEDQNGDKIKERRNGSGAKVYGVNLDAKVAHGREAQLQLGFTVQRSRYNRAEVWTSEGEEEQTTKRMPRTPDYYGYFTFTSAPLKNFDFSLSGTYTGKMIVPHMAGYIEKSRMEHTPQFMDLNLKLNYTFVLKDHIKMQVNGGVQNIFNSFQKDLDKGEFRDAGYFYGPTQPRTYFVGIKIMN